MIDALLVADFHGQYDHLDAFLDLGADIVIIAGDLTDCGPAEAAVDFLAKIDVPCFAVPGNCDPPEMIEIIEQSSAVNLHGATIEMGSITLTGIGASNPTPFNTPFELSEEQIDEILNAAKRRFKPNVHNVLVAHAPPQGTLDCICDTNVGSLSLRKHMKDFDLVCCAHIHEEKGIKDCEGVLVVNPGMASEGDCALIHFGDEPKDITIELMTV
jgi:Icc-related predicted phosphoesterase